MPSRRWIPGLFLLLAGSACRDTSSPSSGLPPAFALSAGVPAPYVLKDISPAAGHNSTATDINDRGAVVGTDWTAGHAFLRQPDGRYVELAPLPGGGFARPFAVNNSGQVTGYSHTQAGPAHAVRWTGTAVDDLGSLVGPFGSSHGNGINNIGAVVGQSDALFGLYRLRPFLWSPRERKMRDLGSFGGATGEAWDINDSGTVVGESDLRPFGIHAFVWTEARGMIDIGTLGGADSRALGINNIGEVVGTSKTALGAWHAFLWTWAGGMVDLGGISGAFYKAEDINDLGQIVGSDAAYRPVTMRRSGPLVDLGDLGISPTTALAINRCGQIVGEGGASHALLWDKPC